MESENTENFIHISRFIYISGNSKFIISQGKFLHFNGELQSNNLSQFTLFSLFLIKIQFVFYQKFFTRTQIHGENLVLTF